MDPRIASEAPNSPSLKTMTKRRSAIEPTIGHLKTQGRFGRDPLKGALGDALHVTISGAGHNLLLLLLATLRLFCTRFGIASHAPGTAFATLNNDAQLTAG